MKSEQLVKFENPVFGEITGYIDEKGEPWFLAGNVCRCLGIKNSSDAINNIIQEHNDHQDHIKGVDIIYTLLQTEGGRQKFCLHCGNTENTVRRLQDARILCRF